MESEQDQRQQALRRQSQMVSAATRSKPHASRYERAHSPEMEPHQRFSPPSDMPICLQRGV